jgi:hypothetical protein
MILTVCPTRERPKRFCEMVDSFYATTKNSYLLAIVDQDDPCLKEYQAIHKANHLFELWETQFADNTTRINKAFERFPDYPFYHITNDDVIYRTNEWDTHLANVLMKRSGVAFGNDLIHKDNLCVTPFISGDVVRALGWLQMPRLRHLYGDNTWMLLGKLLGNLFYLEDVVIEHMHHEVGKAEMDETYRKDNSAEMYRHDEQAFFEWCANSAIKDARKIGEYLNNLAVTASP